MITGIHIHNAAPQNEEWKQLLIQTLPERSPFENGDTLAFSRLSGRIMGTPSDETDYYIYLYELSQMENMHILSETLDKTIASDKFQAVQNIHMLNQKENGLSVNRLVAFLDRDQLIAGHSNPAMHRHIRQSLMKVLQTFITSHAQGTNDPDFRRLLLDIVKWSLNHLHPWMEQADISRQMPRVIWYGNGTKSNIYFLYYLMLIGCDVLLFHPEGKDLMKEIDPENEHSFVYTYPAVSSLEPFPNEKPERKSTVAYRSTKELDTILHHEGSQLYKPWQFRGHEPVAITLKTTYDELFLLAKEKAFIRPNFLVDRKRVEIPNLFAKVNGISANKKEYWDRLHTLVDYEESHVVRKFPFTNEVTANYQFHYSHCLTKEGDIDPEKLVMSNVWQYKHLPEEVQASMAQRISSMVRNPKFLTQGTETLEQVQLYLFTQAVHLQPELLRLIQTFDYSQTIPKLILYHTEMNGELTRSDAAAIYFLNELGIDIILYNPPGHRDIELFIEENQFDVHWLENMVFQQEFIEPSPLRRFFNRFTK
ncbi:MULTISPECIES: YceG family protein [Bacillus]|uniref:Putative component of 'biosynthetic module' domain-containing protein n=2 Tax=Bacillus TaxID=1386 RepID=A0A0M5JHD0_9BACI|nr:MULTISPECIES: YceG family protein [Bacillus]ALC83664.1 hypothetical protein AM592_20655 [Bacillus gobiensis]MBP1082689.1 hypothetical protein [Bacillus capparidis]MED1097086.1 YceG family protein [Bacillus capparidis]